MTYRDAPLIVLRPAEIEKSGIPLVLGAHTELTIRRELPHPADDHTLRAIAQLIQSRFGPGIVSTLGGSLTYKRMKTHNLAQDLEITLIPSGDGMYLQLTSSKAPWFGFPWAMMFVIFVGYAFFGPIRTGIPWWMWPLAAVAAVAFSHLTVGPHLRRFHANCIHETEVFAEMVLRRPRSLSAGAPPSR